MLDVPLVQIDHDVEGYFVASIDLPDTGQTGTYGQAHQMVWLVVAHLVGDRRARADQRHLAAQHIEQLRKLVNARTTDERADGRDARVVAMEPSRLALCAVR